MSSLDTTDSPPTMQIAFVDANTPPFNVAFNKVAAAVTFGRFCHCEIAFDNISLSKLRKFYRCLSNEDTKQRKAKKALESVLNLYPPDENKEKVTLAFFALQGMPLGVRTLSDTNADPFLRKYTRAWKVYRIIDAPLRVVSHQLYWALCQVGKPYDTMGALTCPLKGNPHEIEPDRQSWFCSNHALRFVQHMAICQDMSLRCTTPNSLEKALYALYKDAISMSFETEVKFEEEPSVCDLVLDETHWTSIGDFLPFVINYGDVGWREDQ